jgi:hypothetical protein
LGFHNQIPLFFSRQCGRGLSRPIAFLLVTTHLATAACFLPDLAGAAVDFFYDDDKHDDDDDNGAGGGGDEKSLLKRRVRLWSL